MKKNQHSRKFEVKSASLKLCGVLVVVASLFIPSLRSADAQSSQSVAVANHVAVITVSGIGTSNSNPIFSWVDNNITTPAGLSNTIQIASPFTTSVAKTTQNVTNEIASQLADGNKVLVIGHSIGADVAYNAVNDPDFAGQPVSAVYIDPPTTSGALNTVMSSIMLDFKI